MPTLSLLRSQLLGYVDGHVEPLPGHTGIHVHREIVQPLQQLISDAKQAGFQLQVASGFRHFDRQLLIWNDKCSGKRPILNDSGNVIDIDSLSAIEKVHAILRWSALPGASRHHWGTDVDIYDAAAMPSDYQLQLHPDEYTGTGLFTPMMFWLDNYLKQESSPDFFRPYMQDKGGVSPELWHLSYRPIAKRYEQQYSLSLLQGYLSSLPPMGLASGQSLKEPLEKQSIILEHLPTIYQRFICL
jgi:LAS superfamily LD-carboxypeptidase LdcB